MANEAMTAQEFEAALSQVAGGRLLDALRTQLTADIGADDPAYEETLRKRVVLNGDVLPQSVADGVPAEMEALAGILARALGSGGVAGSPYLAPTFFVWFEWHNRNNSDREACFRLWQDAFALADGIGELSSRSIYAYAKSRWLYQAGRLDAALAEARRACDMAPYHAGFLNNYGEMLAEACRDDILAQREPFDGSPRAREAEEAIARYERLAARFEGAGTYDRYWRPSFIVTRELLEACVGDGCLDSDTADFERARNLLRHLHESGDEVFADEGRYVAEMGRISNAQSMYHLIGNVKRLARMGDEQERRNAQLEAQVAELDQKVTDNRMSVIETLGFFSAIIALIITSVQVGEGLSFGMRALFVLVLLGALLIAFGSLDIIIAPFRPKLGQAGAEGGFFARIPDRAKMLWAIGFAVIVLACLVALMSQVA